MMNILRFLILEGLEKEDADGREEKMACYTSGDKSINQK
jgi:hypothetical protein